MAFDLGEIVQRHQGRQLRLLSEYINPQMARVLKTIGFDPIYVRGRGAHLWDDKGNDYLDMVGGFGVFAVGRSHPKVKAAIRQYLDMDSPNLVKMGTQLLSGLLAEKLIDEFAPKGLDTAFFCNSGAEAVEGVLKFAHAFTGRNRFVYCAHGYHGLTLGALAVNGCKEFREDYKEILRGARKSLSVMHLVLKRKSPGATSPRLWWSRLKGMASSFRRPTFSRGPGRYARVMAPF
jgi:ornithine--oxo-acid transaminase